MNVAGPRLGASNPRELPVLSMPLFADRTRSRSRVAAALASFAPVVVACSGPYGGAESIDTTSQAITGSEILSRGDQWVQAQLPYCQAANHAPDLDPSCAPTCTRPNTPAWDPYRSDCSGFISWSWGLPAPGHTTSEFAPADTTVSYVISGSDLQPGDALNIPGDHIVLFVGWQTVGSVANFYEEPGCSAAQPYAHAFTSNVTINGSSVDIAYEGKAFTAIRFTGLTSADGGAVTGSGTGGGDVVPDAGGSLCSLPNGNQGECLDVTVCASLGGSYMPTAGHCPGAASIQCCTGMPAAKPGDAGDAGDADSSTGSSTGSATGSGTGASSSGIGSASGSGSGAPSLGVSADGGTIPSSAFGDAVPPSGCSVSRSNRRGFDGAWLVGLGAMALARSSRRRGRTRRATRFAGG